MNFCFIGGIFPDALKNEINDLFGSVPQTAADALQKNILEGLAENLEEPIKMFNAYFVPYGTRRFLKIPENSWTQNGVTHKCVSFRYGRWLQFFTKSHSIVCAVKRWILENGKEEKTYLIAYSASIPFLMAANTLKKHFDIDICLVVADLPEFMGLSNHKILYHRLTAKITKTMFNIYKKSVDRYVFLTKQMNDKVNPEGKPYTVMEGIANREYVFLSEAERNRKKQILYSGALQYKYGIGILLEAIKCIPDEDVSFVFYGIGEAAQEIQKAQQMDKRIVYSSEIPREQLFREQQNSTLLINPRQNINTFTKYSFPSKTIEYMLSGNPVIAYKLDGIPDEYDDYLIYPKDNSPQALAETLENVLNMTDEERSAHGEKAKQFVLKEKNYIVQTEKIAKFILGR